MAPSDLLQQNIKYLMDRDGIASVTELARKLQMQQSTLHRMLTGEVRDPKYTTLSNIAGFFGVSPVDLIEQDLQQPTAGDDSTQHTWQFHAKGAPVLGNTQLGHSGYWSDMEYPVGSGDGYLRWPSADEDVYALKCVGDSMMPRIKEGEYVIIEPNHSWHPGDEVLVVTHNGEVMVKTFLFERDGFYHLLPVNEDHAPIRIAKTDVSAIQYVAGIAKSTLWMP